MHPFYTTYTNLKRAVSEVKAFKDVNAYAFFILMNDQAAEIDSLMALKCIEENDSEKFEDEGFSLSSIVLTGKSIEEAEAKIPYYKRFIICDDAKFSVIKGRELTLDEMDSVPELLQFRYPSENELEVIASKFYSLTLESSMDVQIFLDVNCHNGVLPAYEEIPEELIFTREQSKQIFS
jgi:hypothetical protein